MISGWSLVLVAGLWSVVLGAPTPDCSPSSLQEQPPSVRNLCSALFQLSSAYEALIEDNVPNYPSGGVLVGDSNQRGFRSAAVKRQDMDHIFLRFGRRR